MRYQNKLFFLSLIFFLLLTFLSSPLQRLEAREQVGVLDFTGHVREEYLSAAFSRLTQILLDLDRFTVIERSLMSSILKEQHLQLTGLIDVNTAVQAGKILGIHLAFIGHIQNLSVTYEQGRYKGQATVIINIIDVETGALLHSLVNQGAATHESRTTASHRALENALGQELIVKLREIFALSSFISHVEGQRIYIVGGSDIGVQEGYRYWIQKPDPYLPLEETFYKRVGLLEIIEVTRTRSIGRLLYATEPPQRDYIVREVPYQTKSVLALRLETLNYNFDYSISGIAPLFEMSYIIERTFLFSLFISGGYSYFQGLSYFNLGAGGEIERPLVPGKIYLTLGGSLGVMAATQRHPSYSIDWRTYPAGLATAGAFYLSGLTGIKYYFNYDQGPSLQLGAGGRYGGSLRTWLDEREQDVTWILPHQNLQTNGFYLTASLRFPLQFALF